MAIALDADAVIGFLDRSDALHEAAHRGIRSRIAGGEEQLVASAITYAEVLTGALLDRDAETATRGFFADLISKVIPVDAAVAEAAAALRVSAKLKLPDAVVLATAQLQPDVSILLTGDRRLARAKVAGVRVELLAA